MAIFSLVIISLPRGHQVVIKSQGENRNSLNLSAKQKEAATRHVVFK